MSAQNTHDETQQALQKAYEVVKKMVAAGGCAWHEVQTHESLLKYLIEETYEFADTVESGSPNKDVAEELGDVLYQVLFHAALAERDGEGYSLRSVSETLADKLMRRHPHVFGDRGYMSLEELEAEWEHLKEEAAGAVRGSRDALEGVPEGMPPIARAVKVLDRLQRAGILVSEPKDESTVQLSEKEVGEQMLEIIKKAVRAGIDPDRALRLATGSLIQQKLETENSGE